MRNESSTIAFNAVAQSHRRGTLLATLGVVAFSFSFPATVWALDGFGPWSAAGVRGTLAAVLAAAGMSVFSGPAPQRHDWPGLLVVAAGCAIGFPLLTTLALQTSSTAHSAVVIGVLPMATAAISVMRTGARPSPGFWAAAGLGALTVVFFTLAQNAGRPTVADLHLVAALVLCAAGYAEGGRLSSHLAGWRVIAWGVLLAAPVNVVVAGVALAREPVELTGAAIGAMAYLAFVSQFFGFVIWYRGMGLIGVPRASQIQLAQPLLTIMWAVLLIGELFEPTTLVAAGIVLLCIFATQRATFRVESSPLVESKFGNDVQLPGMPGVFSQHVEADPLK